MSGDECREVERLLIHQIMEIADEESRKVVLSHLSKCRECMAKFDQASADVDAIRRWPEDDAPEKAVKALLEEAGRFAASLKPRPESGTVKTPPAAANPAAGKQADACVESLLGDGASLDVLEKSLEDLENLIKGTKAPSAGRATPQPSRKSAGLTDDDRDLIRKELGLDDLLRDEAPPSQDSATGTGEFDKFEQMAKAAEMAAASKRVRRKTEDDWKKMCGTTIVNRNDIQAAMTEKSKETGDTDEWREKAATGIIPPAAQKPVDDSSFLGTTILPAAGSVPKNPTRRFSSVVLAQIKTEAPEVREKKRKIRRIAGLSPAVAFSVGLHAALILVLAVVVMTRLAPREQPPVLIKSRPEMIEEEEKKPEEEKEVDSDNPDPEKESSDAKDVSRDSADSMPNTNPVGIVNPDAAPTPTHVGNLSEFRQSGAGGGVGGTYVAVDRALEWFALHQDDDGKWNWVGYTAHCARHGGGVCSHGVADVYAKEGRNFTPGMTGLILLCYLGSGYTHVPIPPERKVSDKYRERHKRYMETVGRAVNYLIRIQNDGCFGEKLDLEMEGYMYNQGICSMALIEAFEMSLDTKLLGPCRKALDFISRAQNKNTGGWDYESYQFAGARHSRTDTSVSSWQVMAMKAGRDAGMEVDEKSWKSALKYFRSMYRSRGNFKYAIGSDKDEKHLKRVSPAVNAASLLALIYLGEPLSAPAIEAGCKQLLQEPPSNRKLSDKPAEGAEYNFHTAYYWYYGTLVMYHKSESVWKSWKENLTDMLKTMQVESGPMKGTWTPVDEFLGTYVGRLYVTAFNVLNLEVDYRYLPIYKANKPPDASVKAAGDKSSKDDLLKTVYDSKASSRTKSKAVRELARRFAKNPSALKAIAISLLDPDVDEDAKNKAYYALKDAGAASLPYVRNLLLQVEDDWKQSIIVILRDQKDKEALPVLENLAKEYGNTAVKRAAEEAVKAIK